MNVGLIGLDGHQGVCLNAITEDPDLRLAGVACERDDALERMRGSKASDAGTGYYSDWRDLLDKETLDVLCICSINNLHPEQIQAGAQLGLHICSEKPLTTTLEDLTITHQVVREAGIAFSMLLTMRGTPAYQCVRDVVAAGTIGDVCLATSQKSYKLGNRAEWMRSRETFGGTIPFVGIHAMDLIRWTSGREFVECMAYHANTGHPDVREMEDNAGILLKLDNGGSATTRVDYCRPGSASTHGDDRLRLAGNKGVVEVMEDKVTLITDADGMTEPELPAPVNVFADFVKSLDGSHQPLISADDCFRMTEIVLKARESADTGQLIRL